jgi:hypothetical protein
MPVVTPSTSAPAFDSTKAALELQGTALTLQLTQVALGNLQQTPQPPAAAQPPAPQPGPLPTATADVEARIRSAKVLVYENTDECGIGMWIQNALDGLGMQYLNSGVKDDLIIFGAEDKDKISGEFWDMISTRLTRDKAALIAEVWYLDREANGPINKILAPCGVSFRTDWPLAEAIHSWQPEHALFNEPNVVLLVALQPILGQPGR